MTKRFLFLFSILATTLLIAACSDSTPTESKSEPLHHIYTTVYPLQFLTEELAGDLVRVESIYPAGTDEHSFEPTQKDMMKLAEADDVFYIGHHLESFIPKAKKSLQNEEVTFHAIGEMIDKSLLLESGAHHHDEHDGHDEHDSHGHAHGDIDPHLWITPKLGQQLATNIHAQLLTLLPNDKETLDANLKRVVKQLDTLDQQYKEMSQQAQSKTFFVSHAAFGYLAHDYNLEQVAIAGINSQSEPSQKQLAELVALAKEKNIQYIFFEQNVSSKLTEVIQKEIGAQPLRLHNLGVLTDEDLKNGDNYFSLMEQNVEALREALQ